MRVQPQWVWPCLGLARIACIQRLWPYNWWFPCQKYHVYIVYIYGFGQPYACSIRWDVEWHKDCVGGWTGGTSSKADSSALHLDTHPEGAESSSGHPDDLTQRVTHSLLHVFVQMPTWGVASSRTFWLMALSVYPVSHVTSLKESHTASCKFFVQMPTWGVPALRRGTHLPKTLCISAKHVVQKVLDTWYTSAKEIMHICSNILHSWSTHSS